MFKIEYKSGDNIEDWEKEQYETICNWIAQGFGMEDESYHRAYSREVIRQARQKIFYNDSKIVPCWS